MHTSNRVPHRIAVCPVDRILEHSPADLRNSSRHPKTSTRGQYVVGVADAEWKSDERRVRSGDGAVNGVSDIDTSRRPAILPV
jgi:hypothetical protein